jgi:hypothetical protein
LAAVERRRFSFGDLFVLNFLAIVTEFAPVSLTLAYFGGPPVHHRARRANITGSPGREQRYPSQARIGATSQRRQVVELSEEFCPSDGAARRVLWPHGVGIPALH